MAIRELSSLVSRVSPNVPGCPQHTIIQFVTEAARRTAERTLAWRYEIPLFSLDPGVHEYYFNAPAGTDVHAIFRTLVNDSPLENLTLDQATHRYPAWADLFSGVDPSVIWAGNSGGFNQDEYNEGEFNNSPALTLSDAALADASEPRAITQLSPDKFVVLPLPDDEKTYTVRMFVALKPKLTATTMDSAALDDLEEVIVHGALQNLMVIPNSNWTSTELATYHAKQYSFQVAERRARANIGNSRAALMAKAQPFS